MVESYVAITGESVWIHGEVIGFDAVNAIPV
jgi:hypothetical protein